MPSYRLLTPTGSVPLAGKQLIIGSSPDCQVRAEGNDVASHHARMIIREDGPPLIEPLTPACRVLVDGRPVAERCELPPGSVLRVGTTDFHLELGGAAEGGGPARRRPLWRRLLRWTLYAGGAAVALVVLLAVLTPFILSEARVKQTITAALEDALRRDVSIGGVQLELLRGIRVTDLQVTNKVGFSPDRKLLIVKEADVRIDVWKLLRSGLTDLDCRLSLKEPAFFLEREPTRGATNIDDLLGGEPTAEKPARDKDGKQKDGKKKPVDAQSGPLGPIATMNAKLTIADGTIEFDDRLTGATSRVGGLNVDVSVKDFLAAAMKGSLQYQVSMTAGDTASGNPGTVSLNGAGDFDLGQARHSALGMNLPLLSGELCRLSLKNLDASALGRHFGLPGAARAVSADLLLGAPAPDKLTLAATLETPEIDAVALGLNDRPVPGLGARLTLNGTMDTAAGDAGLTLKGDSRLWEELSGKLSMTGIRSEAPAAGRISSSFKFRADVAKLTGGEVGRIFSAREAIRGGFQLTATADGTVEDLPYSVSLTLDKLVVPASFTDGRQLPEESASLETSGRLTFDPATLDLRKLTAVGSIRAPGINGELAGVEFTPGSERRPMEAAGTLRLRADFHQLAERYHEVMPGLPLLHENLDLTADLAGRGGEPIRLNMTVETRRAAGTPDPVVLSLAGELHESPAGAAAVADGATKQWDLKTVKLGARTPQSPSLDLTVTGQVLGLSTTAPEFELHIDQTADLAPLWDRVADVLRLDPGMKNIAALRLAGRVRIVDGTIRGTPSKITTSLQVDATDLLVRGPDLPPEGIADSRLQIMANLDADVNERRLDARALKLTSSFCKLDLSGQIVDWERLLGTYRLDLNMPDAAKTTGLLAAFGLLPGELKPRGTVVAALRADTGAGTVEIERCQLDTDLLRAQISGSLRGLRLVPRKGPDGKESLAIELAKPSGTLAVEECVADLRVLQTLRSAFGGIPEDLRGSGPVRLDCRLTGSPDGEFAVRLSLNAGEAAVAFSDVLDKPARTPAAVELAGSWNPQARLRSLRMGSLELRLGELRLSGTGDADVELAAAPASPADVRTPPPPLVNIGNVAARLSVPEFAPEDVRKLIPALGGMRFGGRLGLTEMSLETNLKELLESDKPLLAGRLAGLRCRGKLEMRDLEFETTQLPNLVLRTSGLVSLGSDKIDIENLALGLLHKRSRYENRLVITRGTLASSLAGRPLLADTSRLAVEAQMASPELRIDEILAAMEVPAPPPTRGAPPPAKGSPAPPAKGAPPEKENPYAFLAGYRLDGSLKADRVVYTDYALTELAAQVGMKDNVFQVSSFSAKAYGGTATGSARADLNDPEIAHEGSMKVSGCDINLLASEAMGYKDVFAGKLGGELGWKGSGVEPARMLSWDGSGALTAEGLAAHNLDRLAPFKGRTADLAQFLAPDLVSRIAAADFKFQPASMKIGLKDGAMSASGLNLTTDDKDPLVIGFKAAMNLKANEPGFSKASGIYMKRLPDSWLARIDYDRLMENPLFKAIPKDKLRQYVPEATLSAALKKCADGGDLYYPLQTDAKSGAASFGRLKGFDDLFKDVGEKALKRFAEDKAKGLLGDVLGDTGIPGTEAEPGRLKSPKWTVQDDLAAVSAKIAGEKVASVELHAVRADGKSELLKGETCKDGETVNLQGRFDRATAKSLELRLLDARGKVLDRKETATGTTIPPEPKPEAKPKAGSMKIEKWDIGGNFLKPEISVRVKVTGADAAKVELRAVTSSDSTKVLKSKACKDGDSVKLEEEFVRGTVKSFEVRLLDADGKVLDKESRGAGLGL
jgi:uncharacterized protein involved in outer membrane biogenesis